MLGTATSFAVLGGTTVTNIGPTTIVGDLGVSPGLAVTGFPPGAVTGGVIHAADGVALQAQDDLTTAHVALAGEACGVDLTGQDLGGKTLVAGVYCFSSAAQLTGALTLDAQGNPDALFIFQIGSALITASNSSVLLTNGATACNTFWQVGSSATLGTTTSFAGTILALTSVSLTTGATLNGRALARNGAVTMDSNHVGVGNCEVAVVVDAGTTDAPLGIDAGHTCAETVCGDTCVDLNSDHDNCGACGNECGWDTQCVGGTCTCADTTCGAYNICVDLDENPQNCGACGNVCGAGQWCDQGACTAACAGTVCDGWCTDLMTNDGACGACGNQCGSGQSCESGACVCVGLVCDGLCVDGATSLSNCGACGNACATGLCCTAGACVPIQP